MLSNWNGPSEQCRVESNCRKHKVLPQLKWALTFNKNWLRFTRLLKVVILKKYKFVLIPYFKSVLTLVNSAELSLTFKSIMWCHNSKQQASNKWALTFNKKWLHFTRLLKAVISKNYKFAFIPYLKSVLTLVNIAELSLIVKSIRCSQ